MKRNHFRSFAMLIGLLACGGACYGLMHLWEVPADGHWTPAAFSPPLATVTDRVEVLVGDEPILKLVEKQTLTVDRGGTVAPVAGDKLVVRINNYDRVRLARVPTMLALAAAAGGALVLFFIGLFAPLISALKPPPIVDLHLEA